MDLKFKDNSKLKLPLFTQLEYIESTGTQYINTGIKLNGTDKIEISFSNLRINDSNVREALFGFRETSVGDISLINGYFNGSILDYYYSSNNYSMYANNSNSNGKIICDNGKVYFNENNIININNITLSNVTQSCFLLADNYNGNPNLFANIKLYRFTISRNNNTLLDLIPVKRRSDNVICMYDLVSETFFTNAGTGDFVAGPEVESSLPNNILLKTTTFYHKNTPNVDGLEFLNGILDYQKAHQEEVKEYYYPTTQLWQDIITEYPDIVQYYNMNHKLCVLICDADDPKQFTEDFLQPIEDYPDLIPIIAENPALVLIIAENPEVIHSLVDTEYETVLISIGSTYVAVKGNGFYITETAKLNIYVPSLSNDCFQIGVSGSPDMDNERQVFYTSGSIYYDYRGRLSTSYSNTGRTKLEIGNKYIKFNDTTILNGNYVTNEITPIDFCIHFTNGIRFYSLKKYTTTKDKLWLVPIQNNGNPCMIDLLTGTKYLNQDTGSFTYSLEPKNA